MLTNQRVEDIDQLLNELEREAQSLLPTAQFFAHLLQRLRFLLESDSVAVLAPTESAWLAIAQQGNYSESITNSFTHAFNTAVQARNADMHPATLMGACNAVHWFATPLRTANFSKGCLLIALRAAPPPSAVPGMLELLAAFAEVLALRQMNDLEEFLDNRWDKLQMLSSNLLDVSYAGDGAALLVNQLVPIFNAARVSLASSTSLGSIRLHQISGTRTVDRNSKVVRTLTQLAQPAIQKRQPVLRQLRFSDSARGAEMIGQDGAFSNSISLPLVANSKSKRSEHAIVVEWQSYEDMLRATSSVVHTLPTLSLAWQQYVRWQRLPRVFRVLSDRRLSLSKWKSRAVVVSILLALGALAYSTLSRPYPLTIEAIGTVEPEVFRTIYTSLDGHVSELLVEDGQTVEANQPLARIQTPDLNLRMEAVVGELRTIQERRNALQIASNQINLSADDSLMNQNRIAAEIKQLDTQENNLKNQLKLIRTEAVKSVILSPIRGTVVAKDIQQQLAARPLRRGDALFRVVDLEGPWHLKIQVADRDSGYVLTTVQDADQAAEPMRFVLDSLPGEQFDAYVNWVSDSVQNDTGDGCFVEMHATIDRSVVERTHMGASARAYFRCGDQPLWFVWCRPLVETIQRRFWFWS